MSLFGLSSFRLSYLKISIFCALTFILILHSSVIVCQKIESEYINELEPGEYIYVITNRSKTGTSNYSLFDNNIKNGSGFSYLKVTYCDGDSLHIACLDSIEFMGQITIIKDDWLLFVHGDSKTYEQAAMRGMDIQHFHNIRVLVFSWPSKDLELNGIKNFKNSKEIAFSSAHHFAELIYFMESFKDKNPAFSKKAKLSLFLHSLGNLLLKNMALDGNEYINGGIIFDNVIINSAAVNQKNHSDWVERLSFQKRIYITSNRSDFNLKGVRIFTKEGKQLGEVIEKPIAKNASYINFSDAIGFKIPTGITHTFFIGKIPEQNFNIRNLYTKLFHGEEINLFNSEIYKRRKDGIGYNIIKTK